MPGVFEELGIGFALVAQGRVISACPAYAALVGKTPRDVIGLTLEDCTHPDDLPFVRWLLQHAGVHGDVADIRKRYLRPDGSVLWVEQRFILLQGADHKTLLVAVRPVDCKGDSSEAVSPQAGLVDYVADMSHQLSEIARHALLPTTCDLLAAASRSAKDESGGETRTEAAPS